MSGNELNYLAPGGKEYTFTAGVIAGLNEKSKVLEIGCGFGEGACNLAERFGCRVTAADIIGDNIEIARCNASARKMCSLIDFVILDARQLDYPDESFDFVGAEGGVLTAIGDREKTIGTFRNILKTGGHLYLTDLILHPWASPPIRAFYAKYAHASEDVHRRILAENGFRIVFCAHLPQRAWDDYFKFMEKVVLEDRGFFSREEMKRLIREETDVYYNHGGREGLSYIYLIARKL